MSEPVLQHAFVNPRELSRLDVLKAFLPTIHYWARHYAHRQHQVLDFEDLVMVGIIGLIDAIAKFDPSHKNKFKTYAEFRIRGEIIDELRRQDWMTRSERRKQKEYRKTLHSLTRDLGHRPSHHEMGKVLPFPSKVITRMEQYESQETLRSYEEGDLPDQEELIDSTFEVFANKEEVHYLLTQLPPTMEQIVRLRYFEDYNFTEIAKQIKLSEGRVSQLHSQALVQLRKLYYQHETEELTAA